MNYKPLLPLLLLLALSACSDSFVPVLLTGTAPKPLDAARYKEIIFLDYRLNLGGQVLDVDPALRRFFTTELPLYLGKPVQWQAPAEWTAQRALPAAAVEEKQLPPPQLTPPLERLCREHPGALFLFGELRLDLQTRNVVKEVKKEGKKQNSFVQNRHLTLLSRTLALEADSRTFIMDVRLSEQAVEETEVGTSLAETVLRLLDTIDARFLSRFQTRTETRERTLLVQ